MLSNTGTVSLYLYLFFIVIGLLSIFIAYYLIKKGSLDPDKLEKFLSYFKWVIITLAVSTVTLIVSDLFKERDQDIKELEYFDKYVNDVKSEDRPLVRLQLAKYLSIVAPSGEMKKSWTNYYDTIKKEYDDYIEAQNNLKKDSAIVNPTPQQIKQTDENKRKVELFETPLSSNNAEWFIIAAGDNDINGANINLDKAIKINHNSTIIKKGGSFRTVLMGYFSKTEAESQLEKVRNEVNPMSYIVRKATWCNTIERGSDCLICK
ncbi:hypothetical protein [Chryseobacterium sediminis]|uniref:SPOR domain-containing protein n=1 Tax=Chryseobacterium sediminis TaxID=1679494 RepID=A0A5B2UDP5_9FLAO|nr:hypothetical protein [Chryseobacterium sediminis]KAA2224676.1 hypothetical protein FW780_10865 [Chryseobacterium sediminis]